MMEWDAIAEKYSLWAEAFRLNYRMLALNLRSLLKKPAKILDVGCGSGLLRKEIKNIFPETEVFGIDISKKMCCISKGIVADACNLPFRESSFDIVIFSYVLHEFSRSRIIKSLKEGKRVLKKDGMLAIRDINKKMPYFLSDFLYARLADFFGKEYSFHVQSKIQSFCKPEELERMLNRLGFKTARSCEYLFDFDIFACKPSMEREREISQISIRT